MAIVARSSSQSTNHRRNCVQSQQFLLRASRKLARSLDYETTLQTVAHVSQPFVSDMCVVCMVAPDGQLKPGGVGHVNPSTESWFSELATYDAVRPPGFVIRAVRTRKPVLLPELSPAALDGIAHEEHVQNDPTLLVAVDGTAAKSGICMPMIARGNVLGVLSFMWRDGAAVQFDSQDLGLIQQLTRLCAQAVDNASLYQAAVEAARVHEESLATTSHELRTPLSEIKGFVTTLLRSDVDWDAETRQDFLREIERQADRLNALIGDLLDLSRWSSSGYINFERASTPTEMLVHTAVDRVRAHLSNSALEIDAGLAKLPPVWVDAKRIRQVLGNLVENATKYAPGSQIRISAGVAHSGTAVDMLVEDNGPGIPVEDLDRIFDRFYRGRAGRRSEVPGTGLGLAIARMIIEGHGGTIRAENRLGSGARFIVTLPVVPSTPPNP